MYGFLIDFRKTIYFNLSQMRHNKTSLVVIHIHDENGRLLEVKSGGGVRWL